MEEDDDVSRRLALLVLAAPLLQALTSLAREGGPGGLVTAWALVLILAASTAWLPRR